MNEINWSDLPSARSLRERADQWARAREEILKAIKAAHEENPPKVECQVRLEVPLGVIDYARGWLFSKGYRLVEVSRLDRKYRIDWKAEPCDKGVALGE